MDSSSVHVEKEDKEVVFVYWDIETTQEKELNVPNLVCARTSNTAVNYTFPGSPRPIEDFLDWLRELSKDSKRVSLAHNF